MLKWAVKGDQEKAPINKRVFNYRSNNSEMNTRIAYGRPTPPI